ncbi:cytochrome-b5 reductase [Thelephora ganbajun]|uniref:Cytochrome-b5 reductase n=1 Tax=Thelephora ganbajun TaxID=370292 RepID=A0ACB6Z6S4_THEGA|nr:cytochrome-b5 reductase [Thelephora ganbajun]
MSILRTSFARSGLLASARRYSSAPTQAKGSNLGFYLIGAGAAGLGAYAYLNSLNPTPTAQTVKLKETSPLDPTKFVDFELKRVDPYSHNTAVFTFKLNDDEASLLPLTSFVVVKSSDPEGLKDAKGNPVIRPYTPISRSDTPGELALLVKKYENGLASKYIHGLKPGDKLAIKGPIPKFPYKDNEFEEVGMIAGGTGITPMYQILIHALTKPDNKTKFKLIFANTSEKDILLKEELDALKKKYPQTFDVVYIVGSAGPGWNGPVGYITPELIKQNIAPPSLGNKVKVLVCGPPGQVKAISGQKLNPTDQGPLAGTLRDLGFDETQVFKF